MHCAGRQPSGRRESPISYDPQRKDTGAYRWPNALRGTVLRNQLRYRAWRFRLRTERAEVQFMLKNLRRGHTAIDVGAHKGAYTYWMRRRVGAEGRVVGFEPLPHLAEYLHQLRRAFAWSNVAIAEAGLGSETSEMKLYIPSACLGTTTLRPHPDRDTLQVRVVTLDDYCAEHDVGPVDFIKCDIEGHELEFFRGAQRVLETDRPALLFECFDFSHPGGHLRRVLDYLRGFGYDGVFFPHGQQAPISKYDTSLHLADERHPSYSANFGLLHADAVTAAACGRRAAGTGSRCRLP